MFGRYVDFESNNTRSSHETRHGHISPAEFGLYNKYKEINFSPMSENRISGYGDRFNQNDLVIHTRKGTKSCHNLSEPFQESELTRWIDNLRFWNGQAFSQLNPQMVIQTHTSLTGWGAVRNGVQTSVQWSEEE